MFQGSYEQLLCSDTLTGNAMREQISIKQQPRIPTEYLSITDATLHNLKHVSVDIPLHNSYSGKRCKVPEKAPYPRCSRQSCHEGSVSRPQWIRRQ
ncbi:MAG: hypothetical protein ACLTDX_09475 [[Clostridium] innocuum]